MRLSDFWDRLDEVFPHGYARSWARDQVLPDLDGRTVEQALAAGVSAKRVWAAVCGCAPVPPHLR